MFDFDQLLLFHILEDLLVLRLRRLLHHQLDPGDQLVELNGGGRLLVNPFRATENGGLCRALVGTVRDAALPL